MSQRIQELDWSLRERKRLSLQSNEESEASDSSAHSFEGKVNPSCTNCFRAEVQCVELLGEGKCQRCNELSLECSSNAGSKRRKSLDVNAMHLVNFDQISWNNSFETNFCHNLPILEVEEMNVSNLLSSLHVNNEQDQQVHDEILNLEKTFAEQAKEIASLKASISQMKSNQAEKLKKSQTPYSISFQKNTLNMMFLSITGQIQSFNENFGKTFNLTWKDLSSRFLTLSDLFDKEDVKNFIALADKALKQKERIFELVMRVKNKDHNQRYLMHFEILQKKGNLLSGISMKSDSNNNKQTKPIAPNSCFCISTAL